MAYVACRVGHLLVLFTIALSTIWCSLALWFRLPGEELARGAGAIAYAAFGLVVLIALFRRFQLRPVIFFIAGFCAVLVWWNTIIPPKFADWAPDVSRQVTGKIEGDELILTNVRNFHWRSDSDYTEIWESRSYDLSKLRSLDLFLSYWAGPEMAHLIFSFGFQDEQYLAWSIEVRRRKGGQFSPIDDLFKSNPLIIVAADERDVVRVRSNVRAEDVQLYRLKTPPEVARKLLAGYVADANQLADNPVFYNSLMTNCTTAVVKLMRSLGAVLPLDWRLFINGFLPDYIYKMEGLASDMPLAEIKRLSHIRQRALAADDSPNFSTLIRVGTPSPR